MTTPNPTDPTTLAKVHTIVDLGRAVNMGSLRIAQDIIEYLTTPLPTPKTVTEPLPTPKKVTKPNDK